MPLWSVTASRTVPVADSAVLLVTDVVPVRLVGAGTEEALFEMPFIAEASCCASWSSWDCASGSVSSRRVMSAPISPPEIWEVISTPFTVIALKPLDDERVHRAIDRAFARTRGAAPVAEPGTVTRMLEEMRRQKDDYIRYLPIRNKDKVMLQKVDDVSWFEARGKFVRLHTAAESHQIRHAMHSLAGQLDPARFIRISRSSIINVDHIVHLEPWSHGEWAVTLRGGRRVVSTHGYRSGLQRLLRAR